MRYKKLLSSFELYEVDILSSSKDDLSKISIEMGLNLSTEEMFAVKKYFEDEGRNPTDIELQTIAQLWSEHCRHKTFKSIVVDRGKVVADNMLKNFIKKATEEINAPWVISFLKDNAGIIDFTRGYAVAVKVETHNHPSAIDPFGGAATGVGGVIRDVLGVWAEPIALTNVLCFGNLDFPREKLSPGIKHPKYLFRGVTAGISYYGNNMGIPNVSGAIYFDDGYTGNIIVYAGCIGIIPKSMYKWCVKPGDLIIVIGNKTGRDGIHGATFASAELSEESEILMRSAVQIPDPIEEEKLKRTIIRIRDEDLGSGITDLGGGGLAVGVTEMADRMGGGALIYLDKLHLREVDMAPWEIWVSESQERMLLSIPRENIDRVLEIIEEEELEASVIGVFTGDKKVKIYFKDILAADINVGFLMNPPKTVKKASWILSNYIEPELPEPKHLDTIILKLLSTPNIASKESVIRTYDHEVKGNTVLKPLQGIYGGPNDGVILKPLDDSWMGLVVSVGLKPQYSRIDPYWMAASTIEEALRNNVVVGGRRIALLDNFTWGDPEKPDRLGALVRAVKACYDFSKIFETPYISGKDSLYNESPLGQILPTLLITGVGIIPDVRKAVSVDLKKSNNPIYLIGLTRRELGASEYYRFKGFIGNSVPKVYPKEVKKSMECITRSIDEGYVASSHDLSEGGLGIAIAEMVLSSRYGAKIWLEKVLERDSDRNDVLLFSESNGRFLLEIKREYEDMFKKTADELGCIYSKIGIVTSRKELSIYDIHSEKDLIVNIASERLREAWKSVLK